MLEMFVTDFRWKEAASGSHLSTEGAAGDDARPLNEEAIIPRGLPIIKQDSWKQSAIYNISLLSKQLSANIIWAKYDLTLLEKKNVNIPCCFGHCKLQFGLPV